MNSKLDSLENGISKLLDTLQTSSDKLHSSDIEEIRKRIKGSKRPKKTLDMFNAGRENVKQCLRYWEQTPNENSHIIQARQVGLG